MVRSIILLVALLSLATQSAIAQPSAKKINYQDHILPFFQDKCVACHNQDKKSSGVILNSYSKVIEGGSSGIIVKAGNPEGSSLFQMVAHKSEPFMPPKSPKVADTSIVMLEKWIKEGLLETADGKALALNKPTTDIALGTVRRGKPDGPPPMPEKPLPLDPLVVTLKGNAVIGLAASPWAPLLAVGGQKQIVLYNTDTMEYLGVIPFPDGFPTVLKFSRNGGFLLAGGGRGGKNGSATLFNIKTGLKVLTVGQESDAVLAADISPDQTQIALGGPSKVVRVYSTVDGKLLHEIKKHTDWITSIEYSPDGVLFASGDRSGNLFVWESHNGKEYFTLKGHTNYINNLSWRADGNMLASVSEDASLKLWEVENGTLVKSIPAHAGGAQGLVFHRDGTIVTSGRDKTSKSWKSDGTAILTMEPLTDLALRVAVSHDAVFAFVGDWNGNVAAYKLADGKKVDVLPSNPPSLKDRVELSAKEIVLLREQLSKISAELTTAKTQDAKLQGDLAAVQKSLADATLAVKDLPAKIKQLTADQAAALALQTKSTTELKAGEAMILASTDSVKKIKEQSDKNKLDAVLAKNVTAAQEKLDKLKLELPTLQKALQEKTVAYTAAVAGLKDAQMKLIAATPLVPALPKQIDAMQKAMPAAQALVAALNTKVQDLEKHIGAKEASLQRYKKAQPLANAPKS